MKAMEVSKSLTTKSFGVTNRVRAPGKPAAPSGELYLFFSFPSLTKHLRLSAKMEERFVLTSIFVGFSE